MTTYNYLLVRGEVSDHAVPGTLYINGNRVCDTLEPASCCLRAGTYRLEIVSKCEKDKNKWIRILTPMEETMRQVQDEADDDIKEESICERCAEQEHQRQLCHRRFYDQLAAVCAEDLPKDQMDAREQELDTIRQRDLKALGASMPCPRITYGTGVIGLPGGTILLGELPEKIEWGDKKIQLPILKNSRQTVGLFLKRLSATFDRGDRVTFTIRG